MELFNYEEVKYLERDTNTPTFFGYANSEIGKGGTMLITVGKETFTVDIDPANGYWSWTPATPLEDGYYNMSFQSVDKAGNVSTPSLRTLIVDTTPPAAPTLLNMYDDQGDITGSFDSGKMTDDRRPTLTGIAEKGVIVYLKEGNTVIGSAKADENTGMWKIEPEVDLTDGQHDLALVANETFAGKVREGKASDAFSIIIGKDGSTPPDPGAILEITHAIDNVGNATGDLKSGGLTDDTTPELCGNAPAGSTVRIQYRNDKGEWIDAGNAVMDGSRWSWTPNPALSAGTWEFRANDSSGWTDEFILNIDLSASTRTEITHAYDDFGPSTGMLSSGAITDDTTPTLYGRAEANNIVYIHYRNVTGMWELLGSVITKADGTWTYESKNLTEGLYEFQPGTSATYTPSGKTFELQIITSGTIVPKIISVWDDEGTLTGIIRNGGETDDRTPTLSGVAEANSTVVIKYTDGKDTFTVSVFSNDKGDWSYTPPSLKFGSWTFTVSTIDSDKTSDNYVINIQQYNYVNSGCNFEGLPSSLGSHIPKPYPSVGVGSQFNLYSKYNFKSDFAIKPLAGVIQLSNHYYYVGNQAYTGNNLIMRENSKAEFIVPPSKLLELNVIGGNKGYYIINFYDKDNNIIHSEKVYVPEGVLHHKFSIDEGLFTKFDIEVRDLGGLYLDNFIWQKAVPIVNTTINQIDEQHDDAINSLLQIDPDEILEQGQQDQFIDDGKTQLMIDNHACETVQLSDILPEGEAVSGWTQQAGTVTIAGNQYHVFSHGDAELLVQDGVTVNLV